jgi:hypothetical protein
MVTAVISPPGASPQTLVPWAGNVRLKSATAPFREPPESQVVVEDFASCGDLDNAMLAQDEAIITAIKNALR